MRRTNAVKATEFTESLAVKLDHLIDRQVAHTIHEPLYVYFESRSSRRRRF